MRDATEKASLVADLAKGALAGAAGVWALDRVTWFMWNRQDPDTLEQEKEVRPEGQDPAHVVANRISGALGIHLRSDQPNAPGLAVHYAIGVVPGAIYNALRKRSSETEGSGLLVGLGLFLVQDELLNPILGISGGPTEYPWQTHVRGLIGHAVYGVTTDVVLEALEEVT